MLLRMWMGHDCQGCKGILHTTQNATAGKKPRTHSWTKASLKPYTSNLKNLKIVHTLPCSPKTKHYSHTGQLMLRINFICALTCSLDMNRTRCALTAFTALAQTQGNALAAAQHACTHMLHANATNWYKFASAHRGPPGLHPGIAGICLRRTVLQSSPKKQFRAEKHACQHPYAGAVSLHDQPATYSTVSCLHLVSKVGLSHSACGYAC